MVASRACAGPEYFPVPGKLPLVQPGFLASTTVLLTGARLGPGLVSYRYPASVSSTAESLGASRTRPPHRPQAVIADPGSSNSTQHRRRRAGEPVRPAK